MTAPGLRLLGLAMLLTGCGGLVVFSDGGESGRGGTTTTNTTTEGGSGTTGSGSGSTSTTDPGSTCDLFCGLYAACFETSSCLEECPGLYAMDCGPTAELFVQCLISIQPPDCDFDEDFCFDEALALSECQAGPCVTESCTSDGKDCGCKGTCKGNQVEQSCYPVAPGQLNCDCYVEGMYELTCYSDSPDNDCNGVELGCCLEFAF